MEKNKEFFINHFKSLLSECKNLQKQLAAANYSKRDKFTAWIRRRQKLEMTEDICHEIELDYFDKNDLKKIIQIICNELLKLIPPRKRKHAQKLLINFRLPSEELTWEKLNAVSNAHSLAIENKNLCATCAKKINWWNFFSKHIDKEGNKFCSKRCEEAFHDLVCDKCQIKIIDTPHYLNKEEREGIICFDCANTKCLDCRKTIPRSQNYFQNLLPGPAGEKENYSTSYSSLCKSCQEKKKVKE